MKLRLLNRYGLQVGQAYLLDGHVPCVLRFRGLTRFDKVLQCSLACPEVHVPLVIDDTCFLLGDLVWHRLP